MTELITHDFKTDIKCSTFSLNTPKKSSTSKYWLSMTVIGIGVGIVSTVLSRRA